MHSTSQVRTNLYKHFTLPLNNTRAGKQLKSSAQSKMEGAQDAFVFQSTENKSVYEIAATVRPSTLERENTLARKQLLSYGARSGKHCQATIVELLVLHLPERLWILGLQAKWVPKGANTEKFVFAIIVGQRSSKFMACGHKPKCGPEIRLSRRREVRCTC